jgi:putative Holliday junction resolvase
MTYLALDVGTRRIGIAVGSTDLKLATPVRVIRRGSVEADSTRIRDLADKYGAEHLLIGFPRELDGSVGSQAERVIQYAEVLSAALRMPFELFDERYSTTEALARRRAAGISDKQGRATIDAVAAAVILQDFFDARS